MNSNMKEFNSFKDLFLEIEDEKNSKNRYPVRFIFLNSFEELNELIGQLKEFSEVILLDSLLDGGKWLTKGMILSKIKEKLQEDSKLLVAPLSEFLRFTPNNDFYGLLKALSEIETNDYTRIYIPFVGIYKRFKREFIDEFYRRDEWAPIWRLRGDNKNITIYHATFDFDDSLRLPDFEIIRTTEDWFNLWRNPDVENVLSFSKVIQHFHAEWLPDEIFKLELIDNQKEFIEKIFNGRFELPFNENDSIYWNKLIKIFNEKGAVTLFSLIKDHLNVRDLNKVEPVNLVEYFLKESDYFYRWLLKNYVLQFSEEETYLKHCFAKMNGLENSELVESLWLEIFNLEDIESFSLERKEILKNIPKIDENKIKAALEGIKDLELKKQAWYVTGISEAEKEFVVNTVVEQDLESLRPYIKECFPELYYYSDWDNINPILNSDEWISEYFKEYNICKIRNDFSENLKLAIEEKNHDKDSFLDWFYRIEKPEIKQKEVNYWIDGLGVEWLPLIYHLLNEYLDENYLIEAKICRVNLPSITKCNKYSFNKFGDLDSYIHNNHYRHPQTLLKELEIVRRIIKAIINDIRTCDHETINIYSDHGFSFLTLSKFHSKILDFEDAKHEGRYLWLENSKELNDRYYMTLKSECPDNSDKSVLLALKHVSLYRVPSRETHGGATPEEVLVPYFRISKSRGEVTYTLETEELEADIGQPVVTFKLSPVPRGIPEVLVEKRTLNVENKGDGNYQLDLSQLSDLKPKLYKIKVKINKQTLELNVNIKGGFIERDLI